MPADAKESTAMEVEVSESKTPKRSTRASANTPKTDTKKPVQSKLTGFFAKTTPKADGIKSPKKEVLSPEKQTRTSPRKSQGGKKEEKNDKKKEEKKKEEKKKEEKKRSINAKNEVEKENEKKEEETKMEEKEIKKEVKEEPMSEDELMKDNSDHESGDEEGSDVEAYEVEKILSHKWEEGQVQYEVKWLGFDNEEEDNTFEPASNLDSAKEILKNYIESLPEEEQEKITGKKKGRPSKRPRSETQPKEKEVAEKKKKESEVAKKGKTAAPKQGAKDSKPLAKIFQKSQKANAAKKAAEVKEENNVAEKLEYIRSFRDKAIAYMAPDAKDPVGPIGLVFQKAAEVLITMIESNAEPEAMRVANEALKIERAQVQPNDKEETDKELRGVIYGVFESLETAMDHIIKKEEEALAAPSAPASIVASDTNTSAVKTECDTDSMFAVSTAVLKKEVKVEEIDEEEDENESSGLPTESADREIKMEA